MMFVLYWIHDVDAKDVLNEGYVGITKRKPGQRFKEHSNTGNPIVIEKIAAGAVMTILKSNLTRDEAVEEEIKLRPDRHIGWNFAAGGLHNIFDGGMPFMKNFLTGDSRTPNQIKAALAHSERMKVRKPWNYGKTGLQKMSAEHRLKISKVNSHPKELVTCPHCSKEGGRPTMTRWHFDKCPDRKQYET